MVDCPHVEVRWVNLGGGVGSNGLKYMVEKCVKCWAIRIPWSPNCCPNDAYDENGEPKPVEDDDVQR